MAQPYPIVGVESTGCHPRLELRDLQKNDIQFSLFIRALIKVQDTSDGNKPNSWWQISGIHGLPHGPWSGDPNGPQKQVSESKEWGGYCYHGSALFPPWHRILILLLEQAIVNEAIAIASELEAKDSTARAEKWVESAKAVRFPFWDWTQLETAQEGIPKVCQETEVAIVNPGGSRSRVLNPLSHYKFTLSPGTVDPYQYMLDWKRTYRWADNDAKPTRDMYDKATKAFSEGIKGDMGASSFSFTPVSRIRQKVAGLFTYDLTVKDGYGPNMWAYFSGAGGAADADPGQSGTTIEKPMPVMPGSIEEPHNQIHLDVGGTGTMASLEHAGFDPMFFLHHCNVDRIYAFWEYVYPEYWVGSGWKDSKTGQIVPFVNSEGTFSQKLGASVSNATPLLPFRNKSLDYWTSDGARGLMSTSATDKYYTYPAITDPRTGVKVQVDVPYDVNDLALRQQFQQTIYNEWSGDLNATAKAHQNLPFSIPFLDLLLKEENNLLSLRQFAIVGLLPEFAYPGSYRLEIYLLPKVVQLAAGLLKGASGVLQTASGFGFGILQEGASLVEEGASLVEEAVTYVVNDISVFGRADPDSCAACRDRRAAGSYIRGYMHLDPQVILYMIASIDPTQLLEITGLDGISALIQGSFGVRLVRPDGTKIAAAEPDFSDEAPLNEAKLPKLTLCSSVVKFDPTDPTRPVQFGEYETHGAFGTDHGWKGF